MTDEPLSERYSDGGVRLSVSTDREREKRKLPPAVHAPFTDWQGGIQFLSLSLSLSPFPVSSGYVQQLDERS